MREEEDISLEEKLFGSQKLADIMEVEEKEHEKEHLDHVDNLEHHGENNESMYNHRNLLSHEEMEYKGNRHF